VRGRKGARHRPNPENATTTPKAAGRPADTQPTLAPNHLKLLRDAGIGEEVIDRRGYRTVWSKAELGRFGFSERSRSVPTLLIPVHDVHGEVAFYQHRPDSPGFTDGKPRKYETPTGASMAIDVPPSIRDKVRKPDVPLFVTEGVKKADAAASHEICCVALLGVWNWRGKNKDGGLTALPDWESIALKGRTVYVVFDSDVMVKSQVHAALVRLNAFLESRGAIVRVVYLPAKADGGKVGLDDFLAAGKTVDDLLGLAVDELRPPPLDEQRAAGHPYFEHEGGIYLRKDTGPVKLANFTARIMSQSSVDDGGGDPRLTFGVAAQHGGRSVTCAVPAARFSTLAWVVEHIGGSAIIPPGPMMSSHAGVAIRHLSAPFPPIETRYAHTGWRDINGEPVYLHGAGAIGRNGAVADIDCELGGAPLYGLPEPPTGDALAEAVRVSLGLLDLADLRITAPVLGAVYRAPLGEAMGAVHIVGRTGGFKSQLAALAQQHFGADMDATHLPGSWESTPNALEERAFLLKDTIFVVDDFVPRGSAIDQQRIHAAAARVFRAQGNRSGRGRMRADLTVRADRPPRGIILSTGEDIPRGESVRARVLVVDVARGDIDPVKLSACQQFAAGGAYALSMAGYVKWLAARRALVTKRQVEIRTALRNAASGGAHRRTAELVADVASGLGWLLRYAVVVGAITEDDAERRFGEVWLKLAEQSAAQSRMAEESDPARRYVELLVAVLTSGRAHLVDERTGGQPADHGAHGWSSGPGGPAAPRGRQIGWLKDEGDHCVYYLDPDAALSEVNSLAASSGEPFALSRETIARRLVESGRARPEVREDGSKRHHPKHRIGATGQRHRVLELLGPSPLDSGATGATGASAEKVQAPPTVSWSEWWKPSGASAGPAGPAGPIPDPPRAPAPVRSGPAPGWPRAESSPGAGKAHAHQGGFPPGPDGPGRFEHEGGPLTDGEPVLPADTPSAEDVASLVGRWSAPARDEWRRAVDRYQQRGKSPDAASWRAFLDASSEEIL